MSLFTDPELPPPTPRADESISESDDESDISEEGKRAAPFFFICSDWVFVWYVHNMLSVDIVISKKYFS